MVLDFTYIIYHGQQELNDGVHWRLTVPSTQLSKIDVEGSSIDQLGPHCSELLHLKFDLLFAAFAPEDPSQPKADLMSEIDRLVPSDPVFTVVATQNLVIENASSGIHSYYPVREIIPFSLYNNDVFYLYFVQI